jgi:hypothetical protein
VNLTTHLHLFPKSRKRGSIRPLPFHGVVLDQLSTGTTLPLPLTSLTRLDRQRNPDIGNRLKVSNLIEYIKLYQKSWLDRLERMDRSRLPKLVFQYQPRGLRDVGRPRKHVKIKKTLSLKGTGLKT